MTPKLKLWVAGVGGTALLAAVGWLIATVGPLAPVKVQSSRAIRHDLAPRVFGIGTVEARLAYAVGPVVPGRVLRVHVDQGDSVVAGQLLAEIDPIDLDRRVQAAQSSSRRAREAVRAAEALVADAESRVRLARSNRDRDAALFQRQAISAQAHDSSHVETERAEATLAVAHANAAAAQRDIERMDAESLAVSNQRDSLKLTSPVNGIIVSREVEPGTTVVAGQAVLRLIAPESLWVRTRVDQSRAQGVQVGQQASIVLRSAPGLAIAGRVARIELQSDPVTEERLVDVSFDADTGRLYLGELAEVTISLQPVPNVLVVPSAAVTNNGHRTGVWQNAAGRAQFKQVEFGSQGQPGVAQVLSGLTEGESFIVYSSAQLRNGIRVREQMLAKP